MRHYLYFFRLIDREIFHYYTMRNLNRKRKYYSIHVAVTFLIETFSSSFSIYILLKIPIEAQYSTRQVLRQSSLS